jgi:RNA recognition motif. (a.k.a. RRM, RBD, or RNP domain)
MSTKLYVANLTYTVNGPDLERLFAAHGTVLGARVMTYAESGQSAGCAIVDMASEEQADAAVVALDGRAYFGRPLVVGRATARNETDAAGTSLFGPMNMTADTSAHRESSGPVFADRSGAAAGDPATGRADSEQQIQAMISEGIPAAEAADSTKVGLCAVTAFGDRFEAERAADELHQAGFSREDVGLVLRGADVGRGGMITDEPIAGDKRGAIKGVAIGGVIGSLFGATACLCVPDVGPVFAGGLIASTLGFGASGLAVGGILGAMAGLIRSEAEAHFYAEEFDGGQALVAVRAGIRDAERANEILTRHGGTRARRMQAMRLEGFLSELRTTVH